MCWHSTQLEEAKTELVRMRGRETELQDQILQEQETSRLLEERITGLEDSLTQLRLEEVRCND